MLRRLFLSSQDTLKATGAPGSGGIIQLFSRGELKSTKDGVVPATRLGALKKIAYRLAMRGVRVEKIQSQGEDNILWGSF